MSNDDKSDDDKDWFEFEFDEDGRVYIRNVGWIFPNYENIAVFKPEIHAHVHYVRNFERGVDDRYSGQPCRSANGAYLDGWYSVPNPQRRLQHAG